MPGSAVVGVTLPQGVHVRCLATHPDGRGRLTEIYRESWRVGFTPVQWNAVSSGAGVLRGVHVHVRHDDYLIVVGGRASIGFKDLRPGSPTEGLAALIEMRGEATDAVSIPTGVAHGFYFHEPSVHLYAVSHYWDPADELACRWTDPDLGIPWPAAEPILSERDAAAGTLSQLRDQLRARWGR